MTTADLITAISETTGIKKVEIAATLEALTSKMKDTLSKGDEVNINGLGKFILVDRKARTARNPKTGESINVDAKKVVKFKVSSKFGIY